MKKRYLWIASFALVIIAAFASCAADSTSTINPPNTAAENKVVITIAFTAQEG